MRLVLVVGAVLGVSVLGGMQIASPASAGRTKPSVEPAANPGQPPGDENAACTAGLAAASLEPSDDPLVEPNEGEPDPPDEASLVAPPSPPDASIATEDLSAPPPIRSRIATDEMVHYLKASFRGTDRQGEVGPFSIDGKRIWMQSSLSFSPGNLRSYVVPVAGLSQSPDGWPGDHRGQLALTPHVPLTAPLMAELDPVSLALDPVSGEVLFFNRDSTLKKLTQNRESLVNLSIVPEGAQQAYEERLKAALILAWEAHPTAREKMIHAIQARSQKTPFCSLVHLLNKHGRDTGNLRLPTCELPHDVVKLIGTHMTEPAIHRYRKLLLLRWLSRLEVYR